MLSAALLTLEKSRQKQSKVIFASLHLSLSTSHIQLLTAEMGIIMHENDHARENSIIRWLLPWKSTPMQPPAHIGQDGYQ